MTSTLHLEIPASGAYLSVVRAAATGLAAQLQFTYEEIDDLRIAVDEACAQLLSLGEDATMTMRVAEGDGTVVVVVGSDAPASDGWPPTQADDSLAWRILTALSDDLRFEMTDDGQTVRVELRMGR